QHRTRHQAGERRRVAGPWRRGRARSPRDMTAFGHPRRHLRIAGSTNDIARELAVGGSPSGTVVTADEQTAGRGRSGRRWSAPPRTALLASAILRPLEEAHAMLPLAVPLAVS